MATPPRIRNVGRESIPGAPGWFDAFLLLFNELASAVTSALAGRLTRKENLASQVKSMDITLPSSIDNPTLVTFKCELPRPYAVWVGQCFPVGSNSFTSGPVGVRTWSLSSGGLVEAYVDGLFAGSRYRLTFIVE
jgi:hypothetical protein